MHVNKLKIYVGLSRAVMGFSISRVISYEGLVMLGKSILTAHKPRDYFCRASWFQVASWSIWLLEDVTRHVGGFLQCAFLIGLGLEVFKVGSESLHAILYVSRDTFEYNFLFDPSGKQRGELQVI